MKRLGLAVIGVCLGLFFTGCVVSESEYEKVVAEREQLKKKIQETKDNNDKLGQAIRSAYTERKNLMTEIENVKKKQKSLAAPGSGSGRPEQPASGTGTARQR